MQELLVAGHIKICPHCERVNGSALHYSQPRESLLALILSSAKGDEGDNHSHRVEIRLSKLVFMKHTQ